MWFPPFLFRAEWRHSLTLPTVIHLLLYSQNLIYKAQKILHPRSKFSSPETNPWCKPSYSKHGTERAVSTFPGKCVYSTLLSLLCMQHTYTEPGQIWTSCSVCKQDCFTLPENSLTCPLLGKEKPTYAMSRLVMSSWQLKVTNTVLYIVREIYVYSFGRRIGREKVQFPAGLGS